MPGTAPQFVIYADDLTGAADTGAGLATAGRITMVQLTPQVRPPADALVLSTDSRNLTPSAAIERVEAAVANLRSILSEVHPTCHYKKIDSTLRGHPAAELRALMTGLAATRALIMDDNVLVGIVSPSDIVRLTAALELAKGTDPDPIGAM